MRILIQNANLISMSENRPKIEKNMDIRINDDKIVEIGKDLNEEGIEKIIDAKGQYVMPGFVNTHAHIPMSIFRETVDGLNLQEWLEDKIWPMEDKLTGEDIYYASCLSYLEMIETGTTTINDMYFLTDDIIKAAIDMKIRLQTTRTLSAIGEDGDTRIAELKKLLNKYKDKYENITFNVGVHGLYTSNPKYIKKCVDFAKKENLPIHMHFCENTKEVEDIERIYNRKPVDVIENEFNDVELLFAHCVKLSEDDIKRLSKIQGLSVSHCPISNLKLGCGISNIKQMMKNGINVSLGTDGQGSGCNLDMFETMKFTALLQKGIHENAKCIRAYDVLKMATINGAKALKLQDEIGSIDVDKKADIIIFKLDSSTTNPINDVFSDIVYNAKGSDVQTTIINGKVLMENRRIINDKEEIIEKCKNIIDRIK